MPISLAQVAAATGGSLEGVPDPELEIVGPVVVDSRAVEPGSLFVAIPGERVDGHAFAVQAVEGGARAVLAQREVTVPAVRVGDTVTALGQLARAAVDRLSQPVVVGVTGSSGKTSTKDLLAQVLAPLGPLVAPPGSYNTEVGVPLTVLSADAASRVLVLEMGARGAGHIRYLCQVAPPQVGVVLNVGSAHLGEFGDREAVAGAKGELVEALPPSGTAVLNGDDPLVRRMAERTSAMPLMFGSSIHADVRAEGMVLDERGRPSFTLVCPDGRAPVRLGLVGEHSVGNALAAAAVAHALGLGVEPVADLLTAARVLSPWRMEVTHRADGVTVVNDAYNANPESMRAALTAVEAMARGRRIWAVLGEMRELGDSAAAEHEALGRLVAELDVTRLVAVGDGARGIYLGATAETPHAAGATWVPDAEAAVELLRAELRPADLVLVKASRAARLERVAAALIADDQEVTAQ